MPVREISDKMASGELEEGTDGEIYVSCKKGFPVPIFS